MVVYPSPLLCFVSLCVCASLVFLPIFSLFFLFDIHTVNPNLFFYEIVIVSIHL